MQLETTNRNVLTVRIDDVKAGWEQWFLLSSDHHFDSAHCDRKLLKTILKKAEERNAGHMIFGDVFDVMQGRDDRRRKYDDLLPQYKTDAYINTVLDDATSFYAPFAKQFVLLTPGNHETAFTNKSNFDMISAMVDRLRQKGSEVARGGYGGYVRFMFTIQSTVRQSVKLKYHHGSGGGGEVTRGTIQTNRQAVYLPDADIVVNGHTHDNFILPIARERLSDAGEIKKDLIWFVRTPSFKDAHGDGADGWDVETWKPPKPRGAVWLRFYFQEGAVSYELTPEVV